MARFVAYFVCFFFDRSASFSNANVPVGHVLADGFKLGQWVATRRRERNTLDVEKKRSLEKLQGWIWNRNDHSWQVGYRNLVKFADREGHATVPSNYKTAEGYRLGGWVLNQRQKKEVLSLERVRQLEELPGWKWTTLEDYWEKGLGYLLEFVARERHAKVPNIYRAEDGFRLGHWVLTQRKQRDSLSLEFRSQLEALPGWTWGPTRDYWMKGIRCFREFVDREGHGSVPAKYVTEEGFGLGQWMQTQRSNESRLSQQRKAQLEGLPQWTWNPIADYLEEGFRNLREFVDREGHARVSQSYKTRDGFRLGAWVSTQRLKRDRLSPEQQARLEAFPGWVWDALTARWEEGFGYLHEFVRREGHARVSQSYITSDGYKLGSWVSHQRMNCSRNILAEGRKKRLEELSGWRWSLTAIPDSSTNK